MAGTDEAGWGTVSAVARWTRAGFGAGDRRAVEGAPHGGAAVVADMQQAETDVAEVYKE